MSGALAYIRRHPFSIMALCNIVGDAGYLGFAFDAQGFVSLPKLAGALFTISAHIVLLAYGDDQARHIAQEQGVLSRCMLKLRYLAQNITARLPDSLGKAIRTAPVGIPFAMLALNGAGLLIDAWLKPQAVITGWVQAALGICIILGCGLFAAADFVKGQRLADRLLKLAPSILLIATAANILLMLATMNAFLVLSVLAFALSNLAGFHTKIDKKDTVSAGI